jgi:lipopolysaccharide export system protein LptA
MKSFGKKILIAAAALSIAAPVVAQEKLKGIALSSDKPIQITSDKLEIHEQEKRALFDGNVHVAQGTTTLNAAHMIVYYKGDGGSVSSGDASIDRIEVNGNVALASQNQRARAETGVFNLTTQIFVLSGKQVVLAEGDNVLTGCKLTVLMKTGEAKMDACGGRVQILLNPKSRKKN